MSGKPVHIGTWRSATMGFWHSGIRKVIRMRRAIIVFALCLGASVARGQQQALPGPGVIVGVVRDNAGVPIEDAIVTISGSGDGVRTRVDGVFRIEKVKPGRYQLRALRVGYNPQVRRVTVSDSGAAVSFALLPAPQVLLPVVTAASRPGLSGVIGDTAYAAISGAAVIVLGAGERSTTDSEGFFAMDLRPGRYMVRVQKPGFEGRMMSVHVKSDSGRRIAVWLTPTDRADNNLEALAIENLSRRLAWKTSEGKLLTHEEIVGRFTTLHQVSAFGAGVPLDPSCIATVDGGLGKVRMAPLWSVAADEIESVEVYPPGALKYIRTQNRARPLNPTARARQASPIGGGYRSSGCGAEVYVWLRK